MNLEKIRPYPRFKAAGVKTDCETLLHAFQQTQSVRFSEFAKLWREKKYSFIFGGRISEKELMEFTEECFLIALSFALPPHSFQWRTGGLYLLYALYLKQPQPYKVPIRVTLENWRDLQEYVKDVKEQTHHDIHYVFRVLEMKNAFQFVAFHKEHTPTNPTSGCYGAINPLSVNTSSVLQLVEDGFVQHLGTLHQNYINMKSQVVADDSINSISEDLCAKISASINLFQERRSRGITHFDVGEKDKDDMYEELEDIGSHRRALKQRILHLKASTRRSRRNRAVVMDNPSGSRTKTPPRKVSRRKRRRSSGRSTASDTDDGGRNQEGDEDKVSANILSMPSLVDTQQ